MDALMNLFYAGVTWAAVIVCNVIGAWGLLVLLKAIAAFQNAGDDPGAKSKATDRAVAALLVSALFFAGNAWVPALMTLLRTGLPAVGGGAGA